MSQIISHETVYIVRYTGPFGFMKPWSAVRDGETFSQQFLTPSIIEGMRQKLEVSAILRHRLRYAGYSKQQETTQSRGLKEERSGNQKRFARSTGIINRHILLHPELTLAFPTLADAEVAATQHLCLCRNEDLVYPQDAPRALTLDEFDALEGIELIETAENDDESFFIGLHRFLPDKRMYGRLHIVGNPIIGSTSGEVE